MLGLRPKRLKKAAEILPPADANQLIRAQSIGGAALAALATTIVANYTWVSLAGLTGRFFPWFSVLQGALIGILVRRHGQGLDWQFPALAASFAVLASFSGGFFVALATTVTELEAGSFRIIRALTLRTFQVYYDEVVSPVDFVYAFAAACVAAFYSRRRLQRNEEFALRRKRQETGSE